MVMVQKVQQPATLFGTTTVRSQVACQVHMYICYKLKCTYVTVLAKINHVSAKIHQFFISALS